MRHNEKVMFSFPDIVLSICLSTPNSLCVLNSVLYKEASDTFLYRLHGHGGRMQIRRCLSSELCHVVW